MDKLFSIGFLISLHECFSSMGFFRRKAHNDLFVPFNTNSVNDYQFSVAKAK